MKINIKATRYINNSFFFSLIVVFNAVLSFGQETTVTVEWMDPISVADGSQQRLIPRVEKQEYQNGLPFVSWQQPVKKQIYSISSVVYTTGALELEDYYVLDKYGSQLTDTMSYVWTVAEDKGVYFSRFGFIPYVRRNGSFERILEVRFQLVAQGFIGIASQEKDYVANSVLSSGNWYKISVKEDGVYKLDKAFFESMGLDVSTLNPLTINVYGNANGRLNEANNAPYMDDLAKDAIVAIGEADGVFNDEDYFLFYGVSPHRWDYATASGFERNQHIYSNETIYFIRIDDASGASRVGSLNDAAGAATHVVSSYDYRDIHELERTNLVGGGQRWYGELFDGELSQNVTFLVPNIVTSSPVTVQYAMATNAVTTGNSFRFFYNGSLLQTQAMSAASLDFARNTGSFTLTPTSGSLTLNIQFNRVNASVKGYLDFLEITGKRNLIYNEFFRFRDLASVGVGNITQFQIQANNSELVVWDVTNPRIPKRISTTFGGNLCTFKQGSDSLREYIIFGENDYLTPIFSGVVANQNLHALPQQEYIIVTHPNFLSQAQRLRDLHVANGTVTEVVTTEQVYNEFSSGMQDATAIKRFMKMFYDRANGVVADQPKNLLLFGDATYDPKNRMPNNNYFVPTYEFLYSEDHIGNMVTDDFFGILNDAGSISAGDMMQIGVGRLLVSNQEQAIQQVNKIEHYMKNGSELFTGGPNACCASDQGSTFGSYRMNYTLITDDDDDGEAGYFVVQDAEPIYNIVKAEHPEINATKIYCDAYTQTSGAGGERYPGVFSAITDKVENGSMIINYIGHGGEVGAAKERIITIPQIQSWSNINRLGLFITATCEFTRFDDPERVSAGEWVSLNATGGAIALMTTTRSVYFNVNSVTIEALYQNVFDRDADGNRYTFGEIMRLTKNSSGINNNRRSFNLIGDPNLKIALPQYVLVADSINHLDPDLQVDTVRALSKMHVVGHVEDLSGNVLTNFNGVVFPTIYDKIKLSQTLQNEPSAPLVQFEEQNNALYKGKATVKNGYFSFEFIVPKDINYSFGNGKISLYAENGSVDAAGFDTSFIVGGIDTNAPVDKQGPEVEIFLNDESFVSGGITSSSPLLIVKASDEFGINTVGNGVGHDLTLILDGNTASPIVLNDYYVADLDSYQSGEIQYNLRDLSAGPHSAEVKIWDANNNSSVARIEFTVNDAAEVTIDKVLNYPNPFTTKTTFFFEHNQSCSTLNTQIQVYSVSGRLVRTINQEVPTAGFRIEGIDWDGKDDFGDQLAKGVYVYRVSVTLPEGGKAEKMEKLVLLR
jgi:hypothetical protein